MVKQRGLFCVVKAIFGLLLLGMTLPSSSSAQTDLSARLPINSADEGFGDILLVQDPDVDTLYVFGLTDSVPPQSAVTITAGGQTFESSASIVGQFPIRPENAIGVADASTIDFATVTAEQVNGEVISGTIALSVTAPEVLSGLESKDNPPNILLPIVPDDPANEDRVGMVLLTQERVDFQSGGGQTASIIDVFEGLGNTPGDANVMTQSVPGSSRIEVYRGDVDRDAPSQSRLLQVIRTDTIAPDREFVSTGSFSSFSVPNVEGEAEFEADDITISLRITTDTDVFWASITNDVDVALTIDEVVASPNGELSALINGQSDPYAVITAYAENSTDSPVLQSVRANPDGSFSLEIPPAFDDDGFPVLQENVYLDAFDPFNNVEPELTEVPIDDGTVNPSVTSIEAVNNLVEITGSAEALARLQVFIFNQGADDFAPEVVDTLPDGAFLYSQLRVSEDGNFVLRVPIGTAQIIYLQSIDSFGHVSQFVPIDLRDEDFEESPFVEFETPFIDIENVTPISEPNQFDQITGRLVLAGTSNPATSVISLTEDAGGNPLIEPIRKAVEIAGFFRVVNGATAAFPFANEVTLDRVEPNADGEYTVEVLDRELLGNELVTEFFLVAIGYPIDEDGNVDRTAAEILGTQLVTDDSVDQGDENFDRVGPSISNLILSDDILLEEFGEEQDDLMHVRNITPTDLPDDAVPAVVVLVGGDEETGTIDVTNPEVEPYTWKVLTGADMSTGNMPLPIPGVRGINLGRNYWNPEFASVIGKSVVWVSLIDVNGNLSPDPIAVRLDVNTPDPDASVITANGNTVTGATGAVEPGADVVLYTNENRTGRIAAVEANPLGAFFFGGLALEDDEVYVAARDEAGNESNLVGVSVSDPVVGPQYVVMDGFGVLHTPGDTMSANFTGIDSAVTLTGVPNPESPATIQTDSPLFVLYDDGMIEPIGGSLAGFDFEQVIEIPGAFARDIEVVSDSPFAAYVLLGNGVIIPYGDVPFYGDIASRGAYTPFFFLQNGELRSVDPATEPFSVDETPIDPDIIDDVTPRIRMEGSNEFFDDLNRNGQYDSEDTNGNGLLDRIVGLNNQVIVDEDANGNGELDIEPIVDPTNLQQGFFTDIARDLEVVLSTDGEVLGYVILDGNGVMWSFGSFEGKDDVIDNGLDTAGISDRDIFRDLELVFSIEDDQVSVIDYVTINGQGQVFGLPGGPLGAGASDDEDNRGHLSGTLDARLYGFDIVRAIKMSPFDNNGDGQVDYNDGFYVLDGYGGLHAIGGAQPLNDDLFLGIDIARDFLFSSNINTP